MHCTRALLLFLCLGCGAHASTESSSATGPAAASTTGDQRTEQLASGPNSCCNDCPVALPGVELRFATTTAGGAMMFTGPGTELEELRRRVRELAEQHNANSQRLAMMTIPHQAEVVDMEGGAQLQMTTQISNDIQQLQNEIEQEVQWMRGGRCPASGNEACVCQLGGTSPSASSPASESPLTPIPQTTAPPAQEP